MYATNKDGTRSWAPMMLFCTLDKINLADELIEKYGADGEHMAIKVTSAVRQYCKHEEMVLVYRQRGKSRSYQKQCRDCRLKTTPMIAKRNLTKKQMKAALPLYDRELAIEHQRKTIVWICDYIFKKCAESWVEENTPTLRPKAPPKTRKKELTAKEKYYAYLLSPEWKAKRKLVLDRDNGMCRGCLTARATQVHHATYKHLYDELLYELVSLCETCHKKAHDIKD